MKEFLKKIQTGSERNKVRWLILFSGIAVVLVLFIWVKYFDSIIASQTNSQDLTGQQADQNNGNGFAFWQTFKAGLGVVFQSIVDGFHSIFNAVSQPKSYMIKP